MKLGVYQLLHLHKLSITLIHNIYEEPQRRGVKRWEIHRHTDTQTQLHRHSYIGTDTDHRHTDTDTDTHNDAMY
jgi:hypothetical protein